MTGFVGPQGRPLPLTDEEIARLGIEKIAVDVDYAEGDTVRVISGPLESFTGVITELNAPAQKAKVNVTMFGRSTEVELDFVQIKKVTIEKSEEQTE